MSNGFAFSTGSSPCGLTRRSSWMTQPLDSTPVTGASTLLRAAPPLCSASVLSPLWDHHLRFSLRIGATGSHVPHKSLNHVHATLTPGATQAISRLLLGSSWATTTPSFDAIPTLSTLHRTVRFRSSPWPSPDTSSVPFPRTLPTATLDRHDSGAV